MQRGDEDRNDVALDEQVNAERGGGVGLTESGVPVQELDKRALGSPEKGFFETPFEYVGGGPWGFGVHNAPSFLMSEYSE